MNTNLILRATGLIAAITVLCVAGHLPLLVFVALFLAAFSVHFGADLEGDMFFTDEPLGVAITRYAGYIASYGFGSAALYAHLPLRFYVLGFIGSLFTHLVGDALSVKEIVKSFMDSINQNFVLYQFLGWAGLMGIFIALALSDAGLVAKSIGLIAGAISATGSYASYRIYRDGNDPAAHNPDPAPKA